MRLRKYLVLASAIFLASCSVPDAEIRPYQVILVGVNQKTAQDVALSPELNQFLRPFQAKGKCDSILWLPKISLLPSKLLGESNAKFTETGFFEKIKLLEEAQNPVQRFLGQKATLASIDAAAQKQLSQFSQFSIADGFPDSVGAALEPNWKESVRRLINKTSVALYWDKENKLVPKSSAQKSEPPSTGLKAEVKLPQDPVSFTDIASYRQQVHDLLCELPNLDANPMPRVVLLGVAGDIAPSPAPQIEPGASGTVPPNATTSGAIPSSLVIPAEARRAFDRGLVAARQHDYDLAVKELTSALALHRRYAEAAGLRAAANLKLKNYGRAEGDLKLAIDFTDPNDRLALAVLYYNLSALYSMRQQTDLGFDALNKALDLGYAKSKSDNAQLDSLKLDARGDSDLSFLRQKRSEYCSVLERHGIFHCK